MKDTDKETKCSRYEWYKSHGICVYCGHQPAREGRVSCMVCYAKQSYAQSVRRSKFTKEQLKVEREGHREREKLRQQKRISLGLCTKCGKREATDGFKWCKTCRAKNRIKNQNYSRKVGKLPRDMLGDGIHCSTCGQPVKIGYKVCERCYNHCVDMGYIGRTIAWKNNSDHIWRKRENQRYDEYRSKLNRDKSVNT